MTDIRDTLSLLYRPGDVVEVRMPGTTQGTIAGFFDDMDTLAKVAQKYSGQVPTVYTTLNPVNPVLLARTNNSVKSYVKSGTLSQDTDVLSRHWLLFDFDPERPASISSTNDEHAQALLRAQSWRDMLGNDSWPEPIYADSGNGAHLLYAIDLPNDDASRDLLQRSLAACALMVGDDVVKVDTSVYNASRICKLYGTMACKGANMPDRPHRMAEILEAPSNVNIVPQDKLEALAQCAPQNPQTGGRFKSGIDVADFLAQHNIAVRNTGTWQGGRKWVLQACVWDPSHTDRAAYVVQFANGAIAAGCHHNSCQGKGWQDFRRAVMGGIRTGQTPYILRPVIQLPMHLKPATDAAIDAIQQDPDGPHVFVRGRRLVRITRDGTCPTFLRRPADAPVIELVTDPWLREYSSEIATWEQYDSRQKGYKDVHPPKDIIQTMQARGEWPFPPLEGVISSPTLRPNGSVIDTGGYDPDTGLLLDLGGIIYPPIHPRADLSQARTAIGQLQEVLIDFPFVDPCHFSAALALLLTLSARFAITGCVPMFGVTATTSGTGKGLLVEALCIIAYGRVPAYISQTTETEEDRKRLFAVAASGDPALCIDNVSSPLGSPALDMMITTGAVQERVMGTHEMRTVPWNGVVMATGNNLIYRGDLPRRVMPIALDAERERPDQRTGFRHPDLLRWVRQERPRLLVAALTILRAYFNAGCPAQGLTPYGRFEEWSDRVRGALVWAGETDPHDGQAKISVEDHPELEAYAALLETWTTCYPPGQNGQPQVLTLRQVVNEFDLRKQAGGLSPDWAAFHDAFTAFDPRFDGKRINTTTIGHALRTFKGRMLNGKRLLRKPGTRGRTEWWVGM